ncbi:uncharacterized protein LOC103307788 [Acyrthosiphon pisum]|uniref:DUF5641 domain-containing protein n=1 Tax=Acyrthosiphon pisum TaxID=7029 RepID=A0A8R2B0R9_ACYPI|nr:uncharacterized protein LOC103307788 [Acyrthosiphon pisum]|eukprot:XP_008178311.1 PREDICTED: uncharacterized protein LOC103307788 [Acyrthosiphon pisum]
MENHRNDFIDGNLPDARVNPSPAFHVTGLDYAGPISIRHGGTRSRVNTKAYVAFFVCFSTHAIHLELGKADSNPFQQWDKFYRSHIILGEFLNNNSLRKGILEYSHQEGIDWRFILPHTPILEAYGKPELNQQNIIYADAEYDGESILNFEELHTVLVQIEAVLNSRPVMADSDDPDSLEALTPGYFLIGHQLTTFPEPTLLNEPTINCPRRRWDLVQRMFQQFWLRWRRNLAILKEDHQSLLDWHIGKIIQPQQGADGLVRVATIKTRGSTMKQPIMKLAMLPIQHEP